MASRRLTDDEMREFDEAWRAGGDVSALLRDEDTATPAALGLPLQLGDLDLQFTPLSIAHLGLVDSPFLQDGDGDQELTVQDVANALYVISAGAPAVQPLSGYRQRRRILTEHKTRLESLGPDYAAVWLQQEMELAQVWADFEAAAMEHWRRHCADCDLQDIVDAFVHGLQDAMSWGEAISPAVTKKKTEPKPSMWNGWARWLARWWPWASPTRTRSTHPSPRADGSPSASGAPVARMSPRATAESSPN